MLYNFTKAQMNGEIIMEENNSNLKDALNHQYKEMGSRIYSNYSKIGSDNGNSVLDELIKIQQQNKKKESE